MSAATDSGEGPQDPIEQALDAVERCREDLEIVAETDLPFAPHARRILRNADRIAEERGRW